jgi:hypothetical protein
LLALLCSDLKETSVFQERGKIYQYASVDSQDYFPTMNLIIFEIARKILCGAQKDLTKYSIAFIVLHDCGEKWGIMENNTKK